MRHALKPTVRLFFWSSIAAVLFAFIPAATVFADKTSISISAPAHAAPGSEITIRVTATHSANNFLHYTNWLYIMVNGREIARWHYSWRNRPESNVFTREVTYTVNEDVEIKAEGHCNIHGSKGAATAQVSVTAPAP